MTGEARESRGARDNLRSAVERFRRLNTRMTAVHAVLDEVLATPVEWPAIDTAAGDAPRRQRLLESLRRSEADLSAILRDLERERDDTTAAARDWDARARIADEQGRADLALQARTRADEQRGAAAALDRERSLVEDELHQCRTALARLLDSTQAEPTA